MKAPTKQVNNRKFFFFIAAQVVFRVSLGEGKESEPTSMPINTVITGEKDQFPSMAIGRAQQAVQLALFNRLGEQAQHAEIGDVVITNIMNLGYMTDDEFNAKPEVKKELPADVKAALELVK